VAPPLLKVFFRPEGGEDSGEGFPIHGVT